MKSFLIVILISVFILLEGVPFAVEQENPGAVTITYDLHKGPRRSSNQIAVWIEDDSGEYIKTVFATQFTARGGFKKRPQSLPEWRKASNWSNASLSKVDAVSGATQPAGMRELIWDCTDSKGKPVAAGTYVYKIEGNIIGRNYQNEAG